MGRFQRLHDELPLGLSYGGADAEANFIRLSLTGRLHRQSGAKVRGQMLRLDDGAAADDHGALQSVAHLTDISRPVIFLEFFQDLVADGGGTALVFGGHLCEQRLGQLHHVFLVVAQGRHVNVEDVQTVIQVIP